MLPVHRIPRDVPFCVLAKSRPKEQRLLRSIVPREGRGVNVVNALTRWTCAAILLAGTWLAAGDSTTVPTHTVTGNLDERARLQAVHDEMRRECGASPTSTRCLRLKREFRQETRNYEKRHPK